MLYSQGSHNLALGSGACCLLSLSLAHAWGRETFWVCSLAQLRESFNALWDCWWKNGILCSGIRGLEVTPTVPNGISSASGQGWHLPSTPSSSVLFSP